MDENKGNGKGNVKRKKLGPLKSVVGAEREAGKSSLA